MISLSAPPARTVPLAYLIRVAETTRSVLCGSGVYSITRRSPANFGLDRPWPRVGDHRTSLALAQATSDGVVVVDALSDTIEVSSDEVD